MEGEVLKISGKIVDGFESRFSVWYWGTVFFF